MLKKRNKIWQTAYDQFCLTFSFEKEAETFDARIGQSAPLPILI